MTTEKLQNVFSSLRNVWQDACSVIVNSRTAAYSNTLSTSLDIGNAYVKAVSLKKDDHGAVTVMGFGCEKIGDDVKTTIKNVLSKMPTNKKDVALSVAGRGVILRYITLPIMSYEETVNSMAFELEKYIPFSPEDINFDFSILKKNKNTGKMLVLIAAAKKELISQRLKLCEEVGCRPRCIDVGPLAVANFCSEIEQVREGVCAVVELGSSATSLDIIEDGLLVLSRDIFIGGNDFTKRIGENLGKNFEEAEQLKVSGAAEEIASSMEVVLSNLIGELKVSFDFYETQSNRLIDKILLSGGSARLKVVVDAFRQSLGQEVFLIEHDPQKLKIDPAVDAEQFRKQFNYLVVAIGTALR